MFRRPLALCGNADTALPSGSRQAGAVVNRLTAAAVAAAVEGRKRAPNAGNGRVLRRGRDGRPAPPRPRASVSALGS
ncbi:MAG: hypothetical protein EA405_00895 [Rhodospirillales bacterium]|nr:MAG: hypothetical protein EA405_00895 [Rhodospirillales bacterium]